MVQGIAIKTPLTALALVTVCVPEALQASPGNVITDSHSVEIHVSIADAPCAGAYRAQHSKGVTVVAVFTNLAVHACTHTHAHTDTM